MEEALLGQKQIRQYFQHFTQPQWDRVAKATMMLGIQQVMLENRAELFWDLSKHSVENLEDLVVTKEKRLIQKQSALRENQGVFDSSKNAMESLWPKKAKVSSPLRDRSKGSGTNRSANSLQQSPIQMERGPSAAILPDGGYALRDGKRSNRRYTDKAVHFKQETPMKYEPHDSTLQAEDLYEDSVAPQLSIDARDELERRIAEIDKYESHQEAKKIEGKLGDVLEDAVMREMKTMPTRRHQKAFERLKGSSAMGKLLKADEAVLKRIRKVSGTLRGQPKQRMVRRRDKYDRSEPAEKYYPVRPRSLQERELRKSRSRSGPSHGRPSSRWRSGVRSEEDLVKQTAEDIGREVSTKNQAMVYPAWWQGYDQIQKETFRKQAHAAVVGTEESSVYDQTMDRGAPLVDRRMSKKRRVTEDSLDARLNAVRHGTYKTAAFADQHDITASGEYSMNNLDDRLDNLRHKGNDSALYYDSAEKMSKAALMSSNATGQGTFQSVRDWSKKPKQQLARTNGSMGSFAYTSNNKQTPKYTALTPTNPKHANQPMTYAGPPNEDELARDAMRHMSGNRNFAHEPQVDSRVTSMQQSGASTGQRKEKPKKKHHKKKDLRKERKPLVDRVSPLVQNPSQIYYEQKEAAERNRRQVEGSTSPLRVNGRGSAREMNGDLEVSASASANGEKPHYGSGLEKRAKGGIALTVFPAPTGMEQPVPAGISQQAIRQRSDSNARKYPFMDSEPFMGNAIPTRERNSRSRQRMTQYDEPGRAAYNQRRVPQRLSHVESSLKGQIEQDRARYLERIKEQNNIAVDERRPRVYDEAAMARSRQSTPSPGKNPQIFYKKEEPSAEDDAEESKQQILEYEEGRDDYYQGPALEQARQRAAIQQQRMEQQQQIPEGVFLKTPHGYVQRSHAQYGSSSETEGQYYAEMDPNLSQEAMMYAQQQQQQQQYYQNPDYVNRTQERPDYSRYADNRRMLEEVKQESSARESSQYAQGGYPLRQQQHSSSGQNESGARQTYTPADVNETGFTQKLAGGAMPSSISYSGDGRTAQRARAIVGTGYYDENRRYVAVRPGEQIPPGYVNSSSQGKDSSQEFVVQRREGADNNTSRFGQMPSEPRYQASQMSSSAHAMNANEVSTSGVQSGEPLVAVKSGEFSAQGPSDPGSKRDEPYKYYDGGASENSARMRAVQAQGQAPMPPQMPGGNAGRYAADRRQLYEPHQQNYYEQLQGETTLQVKYKRERPQMPDNRQQVSKQTRNQAYISDGYSYTGPVAPGTNNFTLQRPNEESNSRANIQNYYLDEAAAAGSRPQLTDQDYQEERQARDYRIGSGQRNYPSGDNYYTGNAPPPNSKYYQTFNDAREHGPAEAAQQQERQHSRARSGSQESGSALRTNFSATGQPMHRTDLEHGSQIDDGADTRTENLRNFMEQAQPGELLNSHGASQLSMSQLQGSSYNPLPRSREPSEPKYAAQETSLQNVTKHHASSKDGRVTTSNYDPSSRTEYKEGGSVEVQSLKQKYLNELQASHNYNASSGQILKDFPPHGTSIEEDRIMRASGSYDEESSPDISVTEQTQQSVQRSRAMEQTGAGVQSPEHIDHPSSSSLQTPAAGDGTASVGRPSDTRGEQSSSYTSQHQASASQQQRSMINVAETEQVQQEIAKLTRDMQELTQANKYAPPQMLTTEDAKSSNDDDSSSLSNSASESDPGKPQKPQESESEELSAVNLSA